MIPFGQMIPGIFILLQMVVRIQQLENPFSKLNGLFFRVPGGLFFGGDNWPT